MNIGSKIFIKRFFFLENYRKFDDVQLANDLFFVRKIFLRKQIS